MADKGIKNVVIKKELLGKVTSSNARVVRFRIVSEDRNRKSAYSQIFITGSDAIIIAPGDINIIGNSVFVNWGGNAEIRPAVMYDVFAGFDGEDPKFIASTGGSSYSFLKNGTQSVKVIVQYSSIGPKLNNDLEVYDSGIVSLV
jgi:hypothetical protein